MNLRELEYLVALAEQQNFGRAADVCGVTQSTLSTQVRKLERELGVELIERGTVRAELTDVGERIVERAKIVLGETNTIFQLARNSADPTSARLRLGLFPTLGPYLLPQVMPAIRNTYPNLELVLVEEKTDQILVQLSSGVLDVAVLALPIDERGLDYVPLFEEDFYLAVPKGHSLAKQGKVSIEALAGEDILLLEDGHCLRDHALDVCKLAGAVEREDFRSTSLETMRQMVASGLGVTLLPGLAVQPSAHDAVELVAFSDPTPSRSVVLCWRSTSAYREFFPQLAEMFRGLPASVIGH